MNYPVASVIAEQELRKAWLEPHLIERENRAAVLHARLQAIVPDLWATSAHPRPDKTKGDDPRHLFYIEETFMLLAWYCQQKGAQAAARDFAL